LRYSLNPVDFNKFNPPPSNRKELNRWNGRVAERLVECYINEKLIPEIKKEEFDFIFFDAHPMDYFELPLSCSVKLLLRGEKNIGWKKIYEETHDFHGITTTSGDERVVRKDGKWVDVNENEKNEIIKRFEDWEKHIASYIKNKIMLYYILNGVIPDEELAVKTLELLLSLKVWTDGFLFKLKKSKKLFETEKLISKINYHRMMIPSTLHDMLKTYKFPKKIPQASGKIEFIEVKSNKAIIKRHQINNYKEIIETGYKMRYFHVEIISFKQNIFDINEKVLNDISDLKEITSTRI
jgi:hypothetical protein